KKNQDKFQSDPAKRHAQNAPEEGEQETFHEKLRDKTLARGADGGAKNNFLLASGTAREQEIGDIDAGNEQEETDGGKKHPKILDGIRAGEGVMKGGDGGVPTLVGSGINFGQTVRDVIEFGVGLCQGDAGFKAADEQERMIVPPDEFGFDSERKKQMRFK